MPILNLQAQMRAPDQYGDNQNYIGVQRILLDSARSQEKISITGSFLYAIAASSKTATMSIELHNQSKGLIPFLEGQFIGGIPYGQIYITNAAQAGEWIDLMYGVEIAGGLQVQNPANQFSSISLLKGATNSDPVDITTTGAAAAVQMVAADATRRRLIVYADTANANTLRVGGSDVDATHGIPLAPGQSIEISSTAAVYVYDTVAGNVYHFYREAD